MPYKPPMSEQAVTAATGHGWSHWFRHLDRWGAKGRRHKEIAKYLHGTEGLSGWWSQMVTGEYEKARGLRAAAGQQSDSDKFDASVQRTMPAPATKVYRALATTSSLRAWLGREASIQARVGGVAVFPDLGEGSLRIVDRGRRLRMGFKGRGASGSTLEITLTPRDDERCAVRIHHTNLDSEAAFKRYRTRWSRILDTLKDFLSG